MTVQKVMGGWRVVVARSRVGQAEIRDTSTSWEGAAVRGVKARGKGWFKALR
jgi:hypothetical protein